MPNTSVRISSYEPGTTMAQHFHDVCSLTTVVAGRYRERIRGAETEHRAGHMLFYPEFEPHSQGFGSSRTVKLIFTPAESTLQFLREERISLRDAPRSQSDGVVHLAKKAIKEMNSRDEFSPIVVEGILLELVGYFGRLRSQNAVNPPSWLKTAREILHSNFAKG